MPRGLRNAMEETRNLRDWVKQVREQEPMPGSFSGLGIGINIRRNGAEFVLNVSVGAVSKEMAFDDQFEMLEQIQGLVLETLGE